MKQLKTDKYFRSNETENIFKNSEKFRSEDLVTTKQKKIETLFYSQKMRKFFLPKNKRKVSDQKKRKPKITRVSLKHKRKR